jgi:hypothetical protein
METTGMNSAVRATITVFRRLFMGLKPNFCRI